MRVYKDVFCIVNKDALIIYKECILYNNTRVCACIVDKDMCVGKGMCMHSGQGYVHACVTKDTRAHGGH